MTRRTPDFIDEQQKTKRARTTTVSTDLLPDEKDANTSSLAGDDDNAVDISEDPLGLLGYATDSGSKLSEPEDDFDDVQEQQSAQNTRLYRQVRKHYGSAYHSAPQPCGGY